MNFIDMTGRKYNRLTVLGDYKKNGQGCIYWKCKCECGNEKYIKGTQIRNGMTKSCGCLKEEKMKNGINKNAHNMSNTRIYHIWFSMKSRCYTKTNQAYKRYGGRGITVCDEWICEDGFYNFYLWSVENGYNENLTLDRIDNNFGYSPNNCRWTTMKVQSNNRRSNKTFEINGEMKTLAQLCDEYGVPYGRVQNRLARGWNIIDSLIIPQKREAPNKKR